MPKRGPNPKKLAAAKIKNLTAVEEAAGGKYDIGQVLNVHGFKSFKIKIVGAKERTVSITSKLFQGGQHSAYFVQRNDWLIVEDKEVVGVINARNRAAFDELQSAGRIPVDATMSGLEEFFDVEEDDEDKKAADATWDTKEAKSKREAELMASRQQQGDDLAARILAKRRGEVARAAAAPLLGASEDDRGLDVFEVSDEEDEGLPEELAEHRADASGAGGGSGRRGITSKRRLAAIAAREAAEALAAESPEERAERLAQEAALAAAAAEAAAEEERDWQAERALADLKKQAAEKNWDEFIDAI
jgi:hypothetical protein